MSNTMYKFTIGVLVIFIFFFIFQTSQSNMQLKERVGSIEKTTRYFEGIVDDVREDSYSGIEIFDNIRDGYIDYVDTMKFTYETDKLVHTLMHITDTYKYATPDIKQKIVENLQENLGWMHEITDDEIQIMINNQEIRDKDHFLKLIAAYEEVIESLS